MNSREDALLSMLYGLLPEAAKVRMSELEAALEGALRAEAQARAAQADLRGRMELLAQVSPRLEMKEAELKAREALLAERERVADEMQREAQEGLRRARRDHARAKSAAEVAESMFNEAQEKMQKFRAEVGE